MTTKSLAVLSGAALGIVGTAGLSAAAGASGINGGSNPSTSPSTAPAAALLGAGTYDFAVDGATAGTITFSSDNSFTSTLDGGDDGNWVQSGKSMGLNITIGSEGTGNCAFAGKVSSTSAAAGKWDCPVYGTSGTWSIGPEVAAALPGSHGALRAVTAEPFTFAAGAYTFFASGSKFGKIKFVAGNTWTSTIDGDDSGTWVASGKAFAFSITGAGSSGSGDVGCLFAGSDSTTGLASSSHPAFYACTGDGVVGDWWANKK